MKLAIFGGGDDPKPKYDPIAEMKILSARKLKYDGDKTPVDIIKSVSQRTGVNPAFLYSSAFQEGMNKAINDPDEISEAYLTAKVPQEFPVDGFWNYGLDTFGTKYPDLVKKGYLKEDFAQQFKTYDAMNELHEPIQTAAFRNNESALEAKAAMLRDIQDTVDGYAKNKKLTLDEKAKQYFTLVAYNSGEGNANKMMDKYVAAKDKKAFIEKGDENWMRVHKNVSPRMASMLAANELFK
jgi:hypothetical protein